MGLMIRPAGEPDEAALRSLHDWLRLEPRLTANAKIAFGPTEADEGALGAVLPEYLTLVPFAMATVEALDLVAKVKAWAESRHRKEGVVISNGRGESVLITTDDDDTVARVALVMAAESVVPGDDTPDGLKGSGHGRSA